MEKIKTYYHLIKPGIIYGNMLTAAAGFFLAANGTIKLSTLLSALGGMALVIASACVFNNYIDRGIDQKMSRTKKRALVTGEISAKSALTFASVLGFLGFTLLLIGTNILTAGLGILAYIVYVVFYGITKRTTVHGTLVGSISGALPPVAGYTAVTNTFDGAALLLFLILTFWQMPHFYAIAMFRRKDYSSANLPVLPVKKGMKAAKIQIVGYIVAFIIATLLLTTYGYTGVVYAVAMVIIGGIWLAKAVKGFKVTDDEKWARKMFGFSLYVLLAFCVFVSVDAFLP